MDILLLSFYLLNICSSPFFFLFLQFNVIFQITSHHNKKKSHLEHLESGEKVQSFHFFWMDGFWQAWFSKQNFYIHHDFILSVQQVNMFSSETLVIHLLLSQNNHSLLKQITHLLNPNSSLSKRLFLFFFLLVRLRILFLYILKLYGKKLNKFIRVGYRKRVNGIIWVIMRLSG